MDPHRPRVLPTGADRSLLEAFGRRLAEARQARGLSQKAIAHELGLRDDLVSRYERGLHAPSLATLLRLRGHLCVSLDYLLAGAPVGGIADPVLLQWARSAGQLPPDHRYVITFAIESMVKAARRIMEQEQAAGGRK